jgi:osmotically-inducible protein OsmY
MARASSHDRDSQGRKAAMTRENMNERGELEDRGGRNGGSQAGQRRFDERQQDEYDSARSDEEQDRDWSRGSQSGRPGAVGEGQFANEFDEEEEFDNGGRYGGQGSQSQGYRSSSDERRRYERGAGLNRSSQAGRRAAAFDEDQPSYGMSGTRGQQPYRGQGGDRSQSGGRQDYGGGYGAGQGQLGYGYEAGSMLGYGSGQGFATDYDSGQARNSGQFRGRGPKGYRRSDDRLTEDINERLTDHPGIDAENIEVRVKDGEVTLTGTVDDRHAKRMAEDVAWQVSGVMEVTNQLRIKRSAEHGSGPSSGSVASGSTSAGKQKSGTGL